MKFEEPVLKFKKLNYVEGVDENGTPIIKESQGVLPVRAHDTDAGYDIVCTRLTQELDEAGKVVLVYHTDVAVELPQGMVGFLLMRSSVSKKSIMLTNCVGTIDPGYRGELMMKFKLTTDALPRVYQIGDKIGQLVVVPYYKATPVFVEELSSTDRGENGYGSTDKKEKSGTDLILETKELAKDVCMQIAAARPEFIDRDQVPAERVEKEKEILKIQTMNEGKPEAIAEKIVLGRINKFYQEICLVDQEFVKDPSKKVSDILKDSKVLEFARFETGEGIEKKEENFAEEVMKQLK